MVTLPQNQAIAESALPLETEKITETPEPEVTIIPEEEEEPEKKSNNSGTILLMLLVLAGVCGAYYYWKFMKGRNTSFDYVSHPCRRCLKYRRHILYRVLRTVFSGQLLFHKYRNIFLW